LAVDLEQLYRKDFYAWALNQAGELRRLAETRPNVRLDFPNLIDEVENLARSEIRGTRSQIQRLLKHLLKLEFSPAREPRVGWLNTADDARSELTDDLTPAIRNVVEPELPQLYERARQAARRELLRAGEREAADTLPAENPYPLDRLIDEGWYPSNRHGLVDEA
jgi:hypothetical protein